ncbi:multicopper oxidase family protein [Alkalibacter saccharofermentans]|uniref:Multicopper oxidase with three cupredoxin domains (Includes cell division protein FtsP and spore coat protein CotA) n=1 Tax=Alkalibacter saccharofermentans DSM 14828 TaxID=1120975 RepID=A0A1M4U4E9_9FIRM|nr:multicopper oxidase domain-containing protein [Alkalibacter saccharofermentans]SHE51427.1 Multicopper oxidase with three cupredoxin domains (includes cell division protein FtsP and spore coat protein CotA) [Alkalibacter saccharofermentans DSM 14828]
MKNMKEKLNKFLSLIIVVAAVGFVLTAYYTFFGGSDVDLEGKNKLKIPEILDDLNADPGIAEFKLEAGISQTEFTKGRLTPTLGYNGSYLGPVIRLVKGQDVSIVVENNLNEWTTIHWHGLVVDGENDGGPMQGIASGETWNAKFKVEQPASTLWYHPHFAGTVANQVYYGLAGLIYIDDEFTDTMSIPKDYGIDDIPLVVQDRNFNIDGSFDYRVSMMGVDKGDKILVNGTLDPYFIVKREKVRFRLLNGSNSQNFSFRLSNRAEFLMIASDGGFLEKPLKKEAIFLSPGERAEIVVDFSEFNDKSVKLVSNDDLILELVIDGELEKSPDIPEELAEVADIAADEASNTRIFELQSMGISGTINGKYYDMNRIDERVDLNATEYWIVRNVGGMMATGHPFHVHGTQFQVVSRNGEKPTPEESGHKDTVYVDVGEEVVIKVMFKKEGLFMYHCHILEHEDRGMMGQFIVE